MYLVMDRVMMSGIFHLAFLGHLNKQKEINYLCISLCLQMKWLLRTS